MKPESGVGILGWLVSFAAGVRKDLQEIIRLLRLISEQLGPSSFKNIEKES